MARSSPMCSMAQKEASPRRRSARILLRIPLLINLADPSAQTEWESVETLTVSLHGGMVRSRQEFEVGATLDIRMRQKNRSARGRVVWRSAERTAKGVEVGFEILDPPGFWEITFPQDRWSEQTRPRTPVR